MVHSWASAAEEVVHRTVGAGGAAASAYSWAFPGAVHSFGPQVGPVVQRKMASPAVAVGRSLVWPMLVAEEHSWAWLGVEAVAYRPAWWVEGAVEAVGPARSMSAGVRGPGAGCAPRVLAGRCPTGR